MTYPAAVRTLIANPPSNLWLLDERTGTTAVDVMAAHNSTISGSPALGQWGGGDVRQSPTPRAPNFDAVDDFAQVNVTANVAASFSAYIWAYFIDGTSRNFYSRTDAGAYTWGLFGNGGGGMGLTVWQTGGSTHLSCNTASIRIPTRQWVFLGFVYLTGSPSIFLYMNGRCTGFVAGGAAGSVGSSSRCAIGRRGDASGAHMLGSLHTAGQARATAYSHRDMQRFYEATRPCRLGAAPNLLRRAA